MKNIKGDNMSINYEYEKQFLKDYLKSLKLFKPILYRKVNRTGLLSRVIGEHFGIVDDDFILAGYYANLGLAALTKFVENSEHLTQEQFEQVKRHPILSYEFLMQKGLEKVANIVYYHHELPDGSGYFKETKYPIESAYVNIADTFEGLISPKNYRPPHTFKEAVTLSLRPYKNGMLISKEELKNIEEILRAFYYEVLESL